MSPGCDNCYAAREASGRLAHLSAYANLAHAGTFTGHVRLLADRLDQPLRWRRPRRIFVDSMSDLFHDRVPDDYIAEVFAVMTLASRHTFQVLTKRHGRMRSLLGSSDFYAALLDHLRERDPATALTWPVPNVWLGVSVESQQWANVRVPALLDTPAAVRFLSCEPLLGPVDLTQLRPARVGGPLYRNALEPVVDRGGGRTLEPAVDWLIVGGESGPRARPMHPDWARSLRDQCDVSRLPFLFKQWGEWAPVSFGSTPPIDPAREHVIVLDGRHEPWNAHASGGTPMTDLARERYRGCAGTEAASIVTRVGKRAAGRALDGQTWDEYPATRDDRSATTSGRTPTTFYPPKHGRHPRPPRARPLSPRALTAGREPAPHASELRPYPKENQT